MSSTSVQQGQPINSRPPRITRERKTAFVVSLPIQLISIAGWLLCVIGFGWLSERAGFKILYGQPGYEFFFFPFAFIAVTPVFNIIYSLYVITDFWILGIFTNLGGTLSIAFGGVTLGLFYTNTFDPLSTSQVTIFANVTSAGSGISIFAMAIAFALLPVFQRFCRRSQQTPPYTQLSNPPVEDSQPSAVPLQNTAGLDVEKEELRSYSFS